MKVENVLVLDRWVRRNRDLLCSPERPTLAAIASDVGKDLGFKVNAHNLGMVMRKNGIATRRQSATESEKMRLLAYIEELEHREKQLKQIIAKVLAADFVPEDLKDYIFAGLPEEMKSALKENA